MLQLTTILFLISFGTLALLHLIAIKLFLYFALPWFDIPMHLFGGVIVALGLYTLRDLRFLPNKTLTPMRVLALVLVVALIWETFEYFAGVPIESDFILDTSIDICMGLLGGLFGYYIGNSLRNLR